MVSTNSLVSDTFLKKEEFVPINHDVIMPRTGNSQEHILSFSQEQRQSFRVSCQFKISIDRDSSEELFAWVEDLSQSGLRIKASTLPLQSGTENIRITFNNFSLGMDVPCCVQWHKDVESGNTLLGLRYTQLNDQRRLFVKYLFFNLQNRGTISSDVLFPMKLLSDQRKLGDIVQDVDSTKLPYFLHGLIKSVETICERPSYVWKWCYQAMVRTTLPCISQEWKGLSSNTKLLGFLLSILTDDLADGIGNKKLLHRILGSLFLNQPLKMGSLRGKEKATAQILNKIWVLLNDNFQQMPRFFEFSPLLLFDFQQLASSLSYAEIVNEYRYPINYQEAFLYQGYNINVVIDVMIDLMCSLDFDVSEVGKLRNIAWKAQAMCRIANWITTWEREVYKGDWTSGVVAKALDDKVLTYQELLKSNADIVIGKIRTSATEASLMYEWFCHWTSIKDISRSICSVNMSSYLSGLETFLQMYWASKVME
ncbi:MAG: PilZ domain-containing protein [Chlamydiae bacterium]|nr:PilZ domain-containing protein [Chlamydiota bacterium]